MKKNQKLNHCKTLLQCTAIKNNKKGQEKCSNWLRGKRKSTNHKYKVMDRLQQVPKDKNRFRVNGSKFKNAYYDKVLSKTAIKLQHFSIVIVKIYCGFFKVEDVQGPCVPLEKQIPFQ